MLKQESKEIEILNQTLNDASRNRRLVVFTYVLVGTGIVFMGEAAAAQFSLTNLFTDGIRPWAQVAIAYHLPIIGITSLATLCAGLFMGQSGQDNKGVAIKAIVGAGVAALCVEAIIRGFGITDLAK